MDEYNQNENFNNYINETKGALYYKIGKKTYVKLISSYNYPLKLRLAQNIFLEDQPHFVH